MIALAAVAAFAIDQHPTATLTAPGTHPGSSPAASPSATGSLVRTLTAPGNGGLVNSVAFAPDGATLATAKPDVGTYLWHIAYRKS